MEDLLELIAARANDIGADPATRLAIAKAGWRRVAGETLARHTFPAELAGSKLLVYVADSTWERQIVPHRDEIIFKINSLCRTRFVRSIDFVVAPDRFAERKRESGQRSSADEAAIGPEIRMAARSIRSEPLREQFLAAAAAAAAVENSE